MPSSRALPPALVALAFLPLLALALAGCSASPAATPASAPSSAAAPAAAHSSASTPQHEKGSPITTGDQLCLLATKEEATSALGTEPLANRIGTVGYTGPSCEYFADGDDPDLLVTLMPAKDGSLKGGRPPAVPFTAVAGLGDQAGVNDFEAQVLLGDKVLEVLSNGPHGAIDNAHLIAFEKLLVSRY